MAIAELTGQRITGTNGSTSPGVVFPSTPTEGNLIVVGITYRGGSGAISAVPSGWTAATTEAAGTDVNTIIYYKIAGASEPTSPTWTLSTSRRWVTVGGEFSGIDGTPKDVDANNTGNGTAADSGTTATTTQADEVCIAMFGIRGNSTASLDVYTQVGTDIAGGSPSGRVRGVMGRQIVSSTGTQNETTTNSSDDWAAGIATFKAESAAAQSVTPAAVAASAATVALALTIGAISTTPAAVAASAITQAPAVTVGNVSVTPAPVTAPAITQAPTESVGGVSVTPAATVAPAITQAPALTAGGVSVVSAPPAGASTLLATLDPVSEDSFSETMDSHTKATPAQLSDASDATYTQASVNSVAGTLRHEFAMDQLVGGYYIEKVVVKMRQYGLTEWEGATKVYASINGSTRAPSHTASDSLWTDEESTYTDDPADSNPWTVAKINGQTWGYYLEYDGDLVGDTVAGRLSEFKVEVWGWANGTAAPAVTPAPTVTVGDVSVTPAPVTATAVAVTPDDVSTVGGAQEVTPAAVTAPAVAPAPSAAAGAVSVTPAATTAPAVTQAPSVAAGGVAVTPAAVAAPAVTPAPTITVGGVSVTPAAVTALAVTQTPTVEAPPPSAGDQEVTPAAVVATAVAPAPVNFYRRVYPGLAGAPIPPEGLDEEASQSATKSIGIRSYGSPYFAWKQRTAWGGGVAEQSVRLMMAVYAAPVQHSSPTELHPFFTFAIDSVGEANVEIGITPDMRIGVKTAGRSAWLSAPNVVIADGVVRPYSIEFLAGYDGAGCEIFQGLGWGSGPSLLEIVDNAPYVSPGSGDGRVVLFNSISGISRTDLAILAIQWSDEDETYAWPITEGHGIATRGWVADEGDAFNLPITELDYGLWDEPGLIPDGLYLDIGWCDPQLRGLPLLWGPVPGGKPGRSVWNWGIDTQYMDDSPGSPTGFTVTDPSGTAYTDDDPNATDYEEIVDP